MSNITAQTNRENTLIFSGPQGTFLKTTFVEPNSKMLKEKKAKVALLGIPYDQGTVYRSGSQFGPNGLREASSQYLSYLVDYDIDIFEKYNLVDCGDVPIVPGNAQRSHELIEKYAGELFDADLLPIFIGGDHSIPIPIVRAMSQRYSDKKIGYIHFDAHMDCQDEVAGERNSNWSTVTRLVELPNISPKNVVLIGIRGALNPRKQYEFVKKNGIRMFTAKEVAKVGIPKVIEEALAIACDGTDAFYVSFDTDVIDQTYAPGTDGPEPRGLTGREILTAAELIGEKGPSAFDIVELSPMYDSSKITARLSCYIIFDLLGGYAKYTK